MMGLLVFQQILKLGVIALPQVMDIGSQRVVCRLHVGLHQKHAIPICSQGQVEFVDCKMTISSVEIIE